MTKHALDALDALDGKLTKRDAIRRLITDDAGWAKVHAARQRGVALPEIAAHLSVIGGHPIDARSLGELLLEWQRAHT